MYITLESELDVIIDNHSFNRDINGTVLLSGRHEDEDLGLFLLIGRGVNFWDSIGG